MTEQKPRIERLRGQETVGRLFSTGALGRSRYVLVRYLPHEAGHIRVAAIAGKRLGGAVKRNLIRRRLRGAALQAAPYLPEGDMVLIARGGCAEAKFADLVQAIIDTAAAARKAAE